MQLLSKCPVPECTHTCSILTNYHCTSEHGMTKEQVEKKYGKVIPLNANPYALRRNLAGLTGEFDTQKRQKGGVVANNKWRSN